MDKRILCALLFWVCCRDGPQEFAARDGSNSAKQTFAGGRNSFKDNARATVFVGSRFERLSGVVINDGGDVLTSLHAVPEGMSPLFVKWNIENREECFSAESLYWDRELDLLVLRSGARFDFHVRFGRSDLSPASNGVYLIGRVRGKGVAKFNGSYSGDRFPNAAAGVVSNYLLPMRRFSSGGGIFRSEDDSFVGINRLTVNESARPVSFYTAAIGQIKSFLEKHHIDFEEME